MTSLSEVLRALEARRVRFVAIGVWAANLYAADARQLFATRDTDLFLPLDPANLLNAWLACDAVGLTLTCGLDPLDEPGDLALAQAVVQRRALTQATDGRDLLLDFTLDMAGFGFDAVWAERRLFAVDGMKVPAARLSHIVRSKLLAGRPKDRLFLATHQEMLEKLRLDDQSAPS